MARRLDRMTNTRGTWTDDPCPMCWGQGRLRAAPGYHLMPANRIPARCSPAAPCFACDGTGREPVRIIVRGLG